MHDMTIKELSRLAGVSTATISNVINDKRSSVSEETRKRVLEIIEETGYIPNGIAKSLRQKCSNKIGVITEDIAHFHVGELVAEINRYAKQEGYNVILNDLCQTKSNPGFSVIHNAIDLLLKEKVEGIIYIAWQDRNMTNLIRPLDIPIVYAYCLSEEENRSFINYDNVGSMKEIMDRILALKHRKIALLKGGDQDCYPSNIRFQVYLQKLKVNGIPFREEYIRTGDWSFEDGKVFYRELMALPDPPTVIVSLNDEMAAGVIAESLNTDRQVLDGLSVVGYNGFGYCKFLYPTLATMCIPLQRIGYEAAKQLIDEIQDKDFKHRQVVIPCTYQDGESLKENKYA